MIKKPENNGLAGRFSDKVDPRAVRRWITVACLGLLVALAAACAGTGDDASSDESALAQSGRWALPADVLVAGAAVRITYEEAPKWTTTAACSGKLKAGEHKLGEYLLQHFAIVSSVGGYACRRNTADTARMSVHGTGRALDVFIPKANGGADNLRGDKVANWLVVNAQQIGVQLVIWDRSIWRANGTNAGLYGGPYPHDDHIHVELTAQASLMATPWFTTVDADGGDGGGGDASAMGDGGAADDDDAAVDAGRAASDAGSAPDAHVDAAVKDAGVTVIDAAMAPDPGTGTGTGVTTSGDESGGEGDDGPGETNSLSDSPSSKNRPTVEEDPPTANAGCSVSKGASSDPARASGAVMALALGLASWLRRKRR